MTTSPIKSPGTKSAPNALIDQFGGLPIWICWTLEPSKNTDGSLKLDDAGKTRSTKIPRTITGAFASTTDPSTWTTFDLAQKAVKAAEAPGYSGIKFSGVGIVFEDSLNIVGVDLDKYWKKDPNGKYKLSDPDIFEFLLQADTYTEFSPSGTGAHIFFQTDSPFDPISKKHHNPENDAQVTEIYSRARYFTFTGNVINEEYTPVRKIRNATLDEILAVLGYPWGKEKTEIKEITVLPDASGEDYELRLVKMFASKNGHKIKSLYDGDTSAHGKDPSSADMALCSHLAFWFQKDPEAIRRVWVSSPLGQRPKTQKRVDYQDRTIFAAIDNCKEVYTPLETRITLDADGEVLDFDDFGFTLGNKDVPQLILDNICKVFEKDPRFSGKFRLNSFSNMVECKNERLEWINLLDFFVIKAQREISVSHPYFARLSQEMTTAAIKLYSAANAVNPPVDWLRSLVWDRTPRLNSWLFNTYGTPDDDLHQSMGSNFLKGMVQRITQPGCQMDLVLCLESGQGMRKSSSLRVLAGDWFAENVTSVDNKDDMIVFAGSILVEFSEGAVLGKASIAKLKSVITTTVDKFRPPYERGLASFPRGCVFSLSTNDTDYLKDETGGRRFLIVKLGKVADTLWLKENRNQLFAEAIHRLEVIGENAYEFSDSTAEELRELQESRTEDSVYDDVVIDWYLGRSKAAQEAGFTLLDAYYGAINTGADTREMPYNAKRDIRSIFKRALYLSNEVQPRDASGRRKRRFVPTATTYKYFKLENASSVDGVDEFTSYGKEELDPPEE